MKLTFAVVAVAAAAGLVDAAPSPRAAWPSFPASSIKSFSLNAWGPMEPLSTKADLVLLDANLVSAAKIKEQRSQGKKVLCYINAGAIENWRGDAKEAMQEVSLGKKYKGYETKEQWVNILDWESAKGVMSARISEAAKKGCHGVEFDNVDCHDHGSGCVAGATQKQLRQKQYEYVRWLTKTAHNKGLGVALKNPNGLISGGYSDIVDMADMVVEEANPTSQFPIFKKFADKNKLVISVQYRAVSCSEAKKNKMLMKYQSGGWKNCF